MFAPACFLLTPPLLGVVDDAISIISLGLTLPTAGGAAPDDVGIGAIETGLDLADIGGMGAIGTGLLVIL